MPDMKDRLQALGEMVREQTERGPDTDHRLQFVRNRLRLTAYAERRRRAPVLAYVAVAAGLVAATFALVTYYAPAVQGPLSVALESQDAQLVGQWVEAKNETKQLRFSDGTSVGLGPQTSVQVQETTKSGGTVIVGQGRARAQVVHVKDARWTFIAGPFHVRVTGTEFDLGWDPGSETLELALHQGSVELSGPTLPEPRKVRQGEFVRLQLRTHAAPQSVQSVPQLEGPPAELSGAGDQQASETTPKPAPGPRDLSQASVGQLWDLSQDARLSGDAALARDALLALRSHHGTRGQTAFLLGKIHADQLHNRAEAIRWFQTYLQEVPQGSLSEQTWGRLIELQAGTDAGRKAARNYLELYPNGFYKTLAQRLL